MVRTLGFTLRVTTRRVAHPGFSEMHYVYFIQSLNDRSVYVGSTSDLKKRFKEHNMGQSTYTKSRLPYKLIYYEAYSEKKQARTREIELKKSWGKKEEVLKRLGI